MLKPWAHGPFELIIHGELHRLGGDDFDRRIALISFDNAIEVTITTYLTLNPIQRGGKTYKTEDADKWLANYHAKLDFLETECAGRAIPMVVDKAHIVWYHGIRNDQYHGGVPSVPTRDTLDGIRTAALWVFSILFDVAEVEKAVEERIAEIRRRDAKAESDEQLDRLIDKEHGMVTVAGQNYYTSELLFGVDPDAYREIGNGLKESASATDNTPPEPQA
jgi:hypothetical protein